MTSKYQSIQNELIGNQKTWLVTGVAGFIGSNLLEKLLKLNQKVVGLDNFSTGYKYNIEQAIEDASKYVDKDISHNFKFIKGDITNLKYCNKACLGIDYVLHQAALGSVPRSIEDPLKTNNSNINGFLNMLYASKESKVKRFVYAASSSTYGDHEALPKKEEIIGNPLSPYAVTKYVNELYAGVFSRNYGFHTIGLRYFNIFGKRQDINGAYAAVIPKWVNLINKNMPVEINGDGETSRDFCYIDNAVQMNILAATTNNPRSLNSVYNVALSDRTTLNELFTLIQKRLSHKNSNFIENLPIYRSFREGDVKHSKADITKAIKFLGYQPTHNISEGLDLYLDWFKEKYD